MSKHNVTRHTRDEVNLHASYTTAISGGKCTASHFNCFTPGISVFISPLTKKQMKASVVCTCASPLFILKRQIPHLFPLSGTCTDNLVEVSKTGHMSTRLFVKLLQYETLQSHLHGIRLQ